MDKQFQILSSNEIDKAKWDACVEKSKNGTAFFYTDFLNAITVDWSGIVYKNYEAVMPLPIKKEFGIKYICAIPFVRNLGLAGNTADITWVDIISVIKKHFKYGDIFFHQWSEKLPNTAESRTNYVLPLNQPHENIFNNYKKELKKKINKSLRSDLLFEAANFEDVVQAYSDFCKTKNLSFEKEFFSLTKLYYSAFGEKYFYPYAVAVGNEKLLLGLYLKDRKRIYNFMSTNIGEGRAYNAMTFSINEILKQHENSGLIFDFMGSEIRGVKTFFENFSPINQPYFHYHFNHLPFPLNILKR